VFQGAGSIAEQDGDRPPVAERCKISSYVCFGGLPDRVIEIGDRKQQAFAMTQRSDTQILRSSAVSCLRSSASI
jgi:hypothetical protein